MTVSFSSSLSVRFILSLVAVRVSLGTVFCLIGTWVINCFSRESAAVWGEMPHNSLNITSAWVQNNLLSGLSIFKIEGKKLQTVKGQPSYDLKN